MLVDALLELRPRICARPLQAYLIAFALTIVGLAVRLALGRYLYGPLLTFFPTMLLTALICGRSAAYASGVMTWAAAWLFVVDRPLHPAFGTTALATTIVFAIVVVLFVELIEQLASSRIDYQQREREQRERAEDLARRERAHVTTLREFEAIYDQAPLGLAYLDTELRFVRINARLAETNGIPAQDHIGRNVWSLLPDLKATGDAPLQRVIEHGETMPNVELVGETPAMPGVRRHWLEMFYPVRDADGAIVGVGVLCEETTDRVRSRERERLLIEEVDHRAKNLLAVVQSVVQLTAAPGTVAEYKAVLVGRIQALGRVHSLLSSNRWTSVPLRPIVEDELAPFGDRVSVLGDGPPILLKPAAAQAIAMIVHELATNATKYGALSGNGRVELAWSRPVDGTADGHPPVRLFWRESGGPPVARPGRPGFGTALIRTSVENQLDGRLRYDLLPAGLECEMTLPASIIEQAGAPASRPADEQTTPSSDSGPA